jgi:hypothetical protein
MKEELGLHTAVLRNYAITPPPLDKQKSRRGEKNSTAPFGFT